MLVKFTKLNFFRYAYIIFRLLNFQKNYNFNSNMNKILIKNHRSFCCLYPWLLVYTVKLLVSSDKTASCVLVENISNSKQVLDMDSQWCNVGGPHIVYSMSRHNPYHFQKEPE